MPEITLFCVVYPGIGKFLSKKASLVWSEVVKHSPKSADVNFASKAHNSFFKDLDLTS